MSFEQFDIYLADLNPKFGTEAGKTRPVLIVQSNLLNKVHPSTIICPITTNVRKDARILRVNLAKGDGGLKKASSIMIDQMRSIDRRRFIKKLGKLPASLHGEVMSNISIVLDMGI